MLGRAYHFVIFVFVLGDPEILFVIAIARGFCVGRSRMSARSRRACIGLDRRSTFWRSRSRVSGTEGCPLRISSRSSSGFSTVLFHFPKEVVEL